MATDYLTLVDLANCITQKKVVQFLCDSGTGVVLDTDPQAQYVMLAAESMAANRLLRAYSRREQIVELVVNDPILRMHVAWIACELAGERRPEFTDEQGHGPFWAQYQRSLDEIDRLSKGQIRSLGEQQAGTGANTGGRTSSRDRVDAGDSIFSVAPDRISTFGPRGGQGGF